MARNLALAALLPFLLSFSPGCADVYYITPDPEEVYNRTCTASNTTLTPCCLLHELQETLPTSEDAVTLLLLPGVHVLSAHYALDFAYKSRFSVTQWNSSRVKIHCLHSGLLFRDVEELLISSIVFISCDLRFTHDPTSLEPSTQRVSITNSEFVGKGSLFFASIHTVIIENSTFLGSNVVVRYMGRENEKTDMTINNCSFLNTVRNETNTEVYGPEDPFQPNDSTTGNIGSVLYVSGVRLKISHCSFVNNTLTSRGACQVSDSSVSITMTIFERNFAVGNGSALHLTMSSVTLNRVTFASNSAQGYGGAIYVFGVTLRSDLVIKNSIFRFNHATKYGGAIYSRSLDRSQITIDTSSFVFNSANCGGSLYLIKSYVILEQKIEMSNNTALETGGAIHAIDSLMDHGNCIFAHNTAGKMGGALLLNNTKLDKHFNPSIVAEMVFHYNMVTAATGKGGAILVPDRDCQINRCFAYSSNTVVMRHSKLLRFSSNHARYGSVIHGGLLDRCLPSNDDDPGIQNFKKLVEYEATSLAITSHPMKLCSCSDSYSSSDCGPRHINVTKMYGEVIKLSLVAVDQDGNPVPAVVRARYEEISASLDIGESNRKISEECAVFDYHIFTTETRAELVVEPVGHCQNSPLSTIRVHVTMTPCARGFERQEDRCVCDRRLSKHLNITVCNRESLSLRAKALTWLRYDDMYLKFSKNCPLDYCTSNTDNISLSSPDEQCANHRSGVLCGACRENYSAALGSSKCLHCKTSSSIWLIIAFAIAGMALIAFLLLFNFTVSKGTVNGLIFYTNVVSMSRITNLQGCTINHILSAFIAWLNLDLGIETCLYQGLDIYQKTWMQYSFPLYIWFLVIAITTASHFSPRAMKLFGRNNIAILATLFLLSYNKILKTVITALTFTDISVSTAGNVTGEVMTQRVWTYDGNVDYMRGKHIPLFVVSLLFLLVLSLPYTLILMFGQCLRSMQVRGRHIPCTRSMVFISILDAYHAPYQKSHRYWTGLMLLTRCLLFIAFATYQQDRPLMTNMFTVTVVVMGILTIKLCTGNVYKQPIIDFLEVTFLLNLGILSAALHYLQEKESMNSRCQITNASISISLVTFLSILVYHAYLQVNRMKCLSSIIGKMPHKPATLNLDFQSKTLTTTSCTSTMVDIRESLLT
jgi:predicted outer membrane repeat protein